MNRDKVEEAFQMVGLNELEKLKEIVNEGNVNNFVNEYGQNLLHEAIVGDALEIFQYLLYCKVDINKMDKEGKTPLHYSTAYNSYEYTKLLLDSKGIENSVKDKYGNNPMWVAVFNSDGYYDIVKLLKEHGVDAFSKNNANRSPLDFAIQIEDKELAEILLS